MPGLGEGEPWPKEDGGTPGAAMLVQTHSFHQNLLVRAGHGGRRRIAHWPLTLRVFLCPGSDGHVASASWRFNAARLRDSRLLAESAGNNQTSGVEKIHHPASKDHVQNPR